MMWFLGLAIALTRSWAATYTRGLPPDVRAERREEIDCDLWHQQRLADLEREPVTGTAMEVLARWLAGIPSDVTWRIETGAAQPKGTTQMNDTLPMRVGLVLLSLPLLALVINGVAIAFFGAGDFDNSTQQVAWGLMFLLCPVVTLTGLWLCRAQPRIGFAMVVVGALAGALIMFWMAFITLPVALIVIVFAAFRAGFLPRSSSRQQPA